jgi:hypothetical protein
MGGALAALYTAFWLAGSWTSTPAPGTLYELDAFGTPITVGATVKLICTVTAINPLDPHFGDVQVSLNFPTGKKVSPIQIGAFTSSQLVVGS